ncbi:unnamed protein product, partial [Meganyctiphanes norvegica]
MTTSLTAKYISTFHVVILFFLPKRSARCAGPKDQPSIVKSIVAALAWMAAATSKLADVKQAFGHSVYWEMALILAVPNRHCLTHYVSRNCGFSQLCVKRKRGKLKHVTFFIKIQEYHKFSGVERETIDSDHKLSQQFLSITSLMKKKLNELCEINISSVDHESSLTNPIYYVDDIQSIILHCEILNKLYNVKPEFTVTRTGHDHKPCSKRVRVAFDRYSYGHCCNSLSQAKSVTRLAEQHRRDHHIMSVTRDLAIACGLVANKVLSTSKNCFWVMLPSYHGASSNSETSQVFVCQLCKKFAQSHVEVLNHITTTHPNYVNSINDCVTELHSISQQSEKHCHSAVSSSDLMAVNVSAQTSVDAQNKLENESQNIDLHIICKEVKKRKVGRPRKDENKFEENIGLPGKKLCIFQNGKIICINCKKTFMKQRQFDKHICVMENIMPDNGMEILEKPKRKCQKENVEIKDEFMESMDELMNLAAGIADEEDWKEDEEWKYNKEWKQSNKKHNSSTRINSTRNAKRKRGRPPKVETMALLAEELESNQEPETSLREPYNSDYMTNSEEFANQCINELIVTKEVKSSMDLKSIQTVPLFSNTKQQEHLQKWVSQVDLSFADAIIDIVPASLTMEKTPEPRFTKSRLEELGLMRYICQECNRQFKTLLSCRRHCAKHLSVKAFTCPDCDYATGSVGSLYSHYRIHTGNLYACNNCDFKARIKAHYRDHLETHNPSRHVCELCQRVYSTANSLSSHIYKSHRDQRGLNYCKTNRIQKTMKTKVNNHLEYFQKLSNAKKKVFIDSYLSKEKLEKTFIKTPMKCEVCGEDFECNRKHQIKHKIVFICWCCSLPYVNLNNLRQHLRKSSTAPATFQENFKLSLLCSFTTKATFISLIDGR